MSEHGKFDPKKKKWFCNGWIDKKQWIEIHGYSPIDTSIESEKDIDDYNDSI